MSLHTMGIDLSLHCPFLPGSLCMADGVTVCTVCMCVCLLCPAVSVWMVQPSSPQHRQLVLK